MLDELILYVTRSLVQFPDAVELYSRSRGHSIVYFLTVDPRDMGKVIGRGGRIAKALRNLVSVAATREGIRASLEIRET